jgi:hypothetical protein
MIGNELKRKETYMKLKEMTKFSQFTVEIFIYSIKPFLEFFLGELANRVMGRVMIHIGKKDSLRKGRSYVFP